MLPPVLEVYVAWHPADIRGATFAEDVMNHFHGRRFTGLVGGSIDVFLRSQPRSAGDEAPRPIALPGPGEDLALQADLTVVVPCLGLGLAREVRREDSRWLAYLRECVDAARALPRRVAMIPVKLDGHAISSTLLAELLLEQALEFRVGERGRRETCRDLAQAITRVAGGTDERLTVFVSHTRSRGKSERGVTKLVRRVRGRIEDTRLQRFFDATDLQIGEDWDSTLRRTAARSALLAVRTDLYSSRAWCQREVRIAKTNGMPVVVLDALTDGEERGSFLMDHVPRVSLHGQTGSDADASIDRALAMLVDESLKRVLWRRQQQLAPRAEAAQIDWWAPHAPEPATLTDWISRNKPTVAGRRDTAIRILHPDPPLGPDERAVLDQLAEVAGFGGGVEAMTPVMLSARLDQPELALLPDDALDGVRLGVSVSDSPDLAQLGLAEQHLRLALGEVARMVMVLGGSLAYGGHLDPDGYTAFLVGELQRFGYRERPMLLTLPWSEHRRLSLEELADREDALGLLAEVVYLDWRGGEVPVGADRGAGKEPEQDPRRRAQGLTAMRRFQLERATARLVIGGRRSGYAGRLPGVLEEVQLALAGRQPVFLAGGFGGVTSDIAATIGLVADDDLRIRLDQYSDEVRAELEAIGEGTAARGLANGLVESENRELATTPRAGRVAALVALGLSRLHGPRTDQPPA